MRNSSPFSLFFKNHEAEMPFAFKEQFLASPEWKYDVVLDGVMHEIWYRPKWLKLLFWFLGKLGILVPRKGKNVPTKLAITPGYLPDGRPFQEWNRTFAFDPPVEFNTIAVYEERMKNVAEIAGRGGFLQLVWDGEFRPPDTLALGTSTYGFRVGGKVIYLPRRLWNSLIGRIKFVQRARDEENKMDIDMRLIHPLFGEMFGYRGTFQPVRVPKVDPTEN